jgi:hypothetical protein
VFSPTGLLGAGPQSTAWLYMFWHSAFPAFVIAYALGDRHRQTVETKEDEKNATQRTRASMSATVVVAVAVVVVVAAIAALTLLATAKQDVLSALTLNNRFTPELTIVVSSILILRLIALGVLWRRRRHSVLDLWLVVVMCAWLCDIGAIRGFQCRAL